jgi:hypothetical protein
VRVSTLIFSKRKLKKALGSAILLIAGLWICAPGDGAAYCPANYTESAHGSSGYGVQRRAGTSSADYARGNCAHCHEQHGSIDGVSNFGPYPFGLFAPSNPTSQTDNFCFQCHCNPAGSIQAGMIPNYDYGRTFGGGADMSDNIKDAFNFGQPNRHWNTGSSHNLQYIRNGFRGISEGNWVTSATNACRICHDPHTAQRNRIVRIISEPCNQPPGTPRGGVETALYHPASVLVGKPRSLWGDEIHSGDREMQSELGIGVYQAPFRADSGYEPAGDNISDGSNMPNYNSFCLGCHKYAIPSGYTDADPNTTGGTRALFAIEWGATGNYHGGRNGFPKSSDGPSGPCLYGSLKPPYQNALDENYVLACTDCHEPHGSRSAFLLRTVVNGKQVPPIEQWLGGTDSSAKFEFCTACHELTIPCGDHSTTDPSACGVAYCHDHSEDTF